METKSEPHENEDVEVLSYMLYNYEENNLESSMKKEMDIKEECPQIKEEELNLSDDFDGQNYNNIEFLFNDIIYENEQGKSDYEQEKSEYEEIEETETAQDKESSDDESHDEIIMEAKYDGGMIDINIKIEGSRANAPFDPHDTYNNSVEQVLKAVENNKFLVNEPLIISDVHTSDGRPVDFNDDADILEEEQKFIQISEDDLATLPTNESNVNTSKNEEERNTTFKIDKSKKKKSEKNKNAQIMTDHEYGILKSVVQMKCKKCLVQFEPERNAINTCSKCNWKLAFQCKICLSMFFKVSNTITHLFKFHKTVKQHERSLGKIASEMYDFRCWKCSMSFKSKAHRDDHEFKCKVVPNFQCSFCPSAVTYQEQLKIHLLQHHRDRIKGSDLKELSGKAFVDGNDVFKDLEKMMVAFCYSCEEQVPVQKDGNIGCFKCQKRLKYKCNHSLCSGKHIFSSMDSMVLHLRQEHLELHSCKRCTMPFDTLGELVRHKPNCGGKFGETRPKESETSETEKIPEHDCERCKKSFATKTALKVHTSKWCHGKDGVVKYRCAHCTYRGFDKQRLLTHLRYSHVHLFTGKLMKCKKCGTSWSSIYTMNDHVGKCTGDYEKELEKQKRLQVKRKMKVL